MFYLRLTIHFAAFLINFAFVILPKTFAARTSTHKPKPIETGRSRDLLYFSFVEWEGAYQRPHHLAHHLSEHFNVYYISLNRIHHLVRKGGSVFGYKPLKKIEENLSVISPPAFPLDRRYSCFRLFNNMILLYYVRKYSSSTGENHPPPIVIVNAPFFNFVTDRLDSASLVYDIMDELTEAPTCPLSLKEEEKALIGKADIITAGTQSISRKKCKESGKKVQFIPCGVDFEHFNRVVGNPPSAPPKSIADIPKPLVGFFGAINERIDMELVEYLCDNVDASFLFIGPIYPSAGRLPKRENLHFIGAVSYDELPEYQFFFDAAIVPYRLSEGIQYVNPVKILEYLSGEKPVVSTAIPDVIEFFSDSVEIAKTKSEFAEKLTSVLSQKDTAKTAKGIAHAKSCSWQEMADRFYRMIVS